jgi:hypothetical protein
VAGLINLAMVAIRVPPIQFQVQAGNPLKLVTTDILSGCGAISLPAGVAGIAALLNSSGALTLSSAMAAINIALPSMLSTLATYISGASGGYLTNLNALVTALTSGNMPSLQQTVAAAASSVVSAAGTIAFLSNIAGDIGAAAPPSLTSIFSSITGGQLNTAMSGVTSAFNQLVSDIAGGTGSFASVVAADTAAMVSALEAGLTAVANVVSGIESSIESAISGLAHSLSGASAIIGGFLCPELSAFASFINSIATTGLTALLPH